MTVNLKEMDLQELEIFFEGIGEKKFRARQAFAWMYGSNRGPGAPAEESGQARRQAPGRAVYDFQDMTDLSLALRQKLEASAYIGKLRQEERRISTDGSRKYLFALEDGKLIESVFMPYRHGHTVCISSQAGCRMGCCFCASAVNGLERNLSGGEMADQVLAIQNDTNQVVSNIVVMGTGEPFDNYGNLCRFLRLVHAKEGLHIGLRSITVSTCGLTKRIRDFSRDFPQVNLAISLHAPNDAIREKLMPVHKKDGMEELLSVCRAYAQDTGRRVTFEYALIRGLNDAPAHAKELAARLRGMICHVNLIPLNKVEESGLYGSKREACEQFQKILEEAHIPVTIRRGMGADIQGACGQLRLKAAKQEL